CSSLSTGTPASVVVKRGSVVAMASRVPRCAVLNRAGRAAVPAASPSRPAPPCAPPTGRRPAPTRPSTRPRRGRVRRDRRHFRVAVHVDDGGPGGGERPLPRGTELVGLAHGDARDA